MRFSRPLSVLVLLATGIASALWLAGNRPALSAPLQPPAPLDASLPAAKPPAGMAVYQLPTASIHRSAGFAYQGGSFFEGRDFAMSAVLVKHPKGDLLIDSGFGRDIAVQMQQLPAVFRWLTSYERSASAAEQIDKAGYDRKRLRGILLTHAHWDHVSGIAEFPGLPVWVTAEERAFIDNGGMVTAIARSFTSVRYEIYGFESGPYLGFPKHHDVYGDGSIVVVSAPGHTPGSVIVFLTLPGGQRYALLGDLVLQLEGITLLREKSWIMRMISDWDPTQMREHLQHVAAIHARFPEIVLVPAHDARGYAGMNKLAF